MSATSALTSFAASTRCPPGNQLHASPVSLHRHALESVFAYLDLAALATALAVSRDWQAAVGSMRSVGRRVSVKSNVKLQQLVSSRMRHHVTGVNFGYEHPLTAELLALMHDRMPHLQQLCADQLTIASGVSSLHWPPRLQDLTLYNVQAAVDQTNVLLHSIGQLSQLRKLMPSLEYDESLSFAPLAQLPLLRVLRIDWAAWESPHLSNRQVDEFRALADLESFEVPMTPAKAAHLLRAPHSLRWRSIHPLENADDALCTLLPGLSCLSEFSIPSACCTQFDWLPRMQSLTQLFVGLSDDHPSPDAATQSLVDALQHCPHITSLTIFAECMPITCDQLAACLGCMPALNSLGIKDAKLPSLAFLALPSLALSLQKLSLDSFLEPKPAVSELQHLHGLRSLRQVILLYALSLPLDAYSRALLLLFLPLLESFYCSPEEDADLDE